MPLRTKEKLNKVDEKLDRLRRTLALFLSKRYPEKRSLDDYLYLDYFWKLADKKAFISDLKLQQKILETTRELLEAESEGEFDKEETGEGAFCFIEDRNPERSMTPGLPSILDCGA